jgi:hypothetical protein
LRGVERHELVTSVTQRVHPPLPDPRPARRLSSHSPLRPFRQCQPSRQYRIGPPAARRTRPSPVKRPGQRRRRWSRKRRLEHLSLLRRAHGHHRDLRTRLPAPALAHAISPPRQLVTNTLVSPSPATAPLRRRHLTGDTNARSTAMVNAAFHRQSADHSLRHHCSGCTRGPQNHGCDTRSAAVPVPK